MTMSRKYLNIDLLRGWAMIFMIEVHVLNAFIRPEIRNESWFPVLNYINGMVAPSFVFISGFVFILSTGNNIEAFRCFNRAFFKRLFRIIQIFMVGYLVHIPYLSMKKYSQDLTPEVVKSFFNVDILQCIGSGLLLLFLSRIILKSEKIFAALSILFVLIFVAGAPFVWNIDFSFWMPLPLACYFNELHGSLFPIFPWLGFLFSGAVFAIAIQKSINGGSERKFMMILFIAGIIMVLLSYPLNGVIMKFSFFEVRSSPVFFMQRLGVIFILLFLFEVYYSFMVKDGSVFHSIGRESLVVYWLHLQIIFRVQFAGRNLKSIVNNSFGIVECALSSVLLIALMAAVAVAWSSIKKKRPEVAGRIIFAFIVGGVLFFVSV